MKGYHGTSYENYEKIQRDGFQLHPAGRKGLPSDLGVGIYFYIEGPYAIAPEKMAKKYAGIFKKNDHVRDSKSTVVKVEFDAGIRVLDLDEEAVKVDQFRISNDVGIKNFINRFRHDKSVNKGALNRGNFDGIVLNNYLKNVERKSGKTIDAVKKDTYTALLRKWGYKQSNFFNGTEICIRNLDRITKISY